MDLDMVVEIPRGSRNKYEMDHNTGRIRLDRTLFTATRYPADYGYFPGTVAEDDDPLDALVQLDQPTFPGCTILVRPIAVFWMRDESGPDAKVLCVRADDPRSDSILSVDDVPQHWLSSIGHFFRIYKALEPGKSGETHGWEGLAEAESVIADALARADAGPSRRGLAAPSISQFAGHVSPGHKGTDGDS